MASSAETDHVIVPPPSALNPIPSLPIALRIDNKERFIELLLTPPNNASNSFRQLLVFGKNNLRTLLMRQVLQDPNTRSFGGGKGNAKNKNSNNKNWDELTSFPLPKNLQTNVIGTKLLLKKKNNGSRIRTSWKGFEENGVKDDDLFGHPNELFQHVDVITYFIRPWDIDQTMEVIQRIKGCATNFNLANGGLGGEATATTSSTRSHKQYHRIVYVPQITLMCTQILKDHHIYPMMNSVSIHSLQLDLFPLASDLISLEYDDCLRECGNVDGTPSSMVETTSRALRKLQDVVGRIPRIQSLGIWGEDVLTKLLNDTVDERYANENENERGDEEKVDEDELDEDLDSIDGDDDDTNGNNTTTVMMLIDRRLDMVTPMVTPLTYEGLLDELVGIDCGFINVDEQIINPKDDNDDDNDDEEEKEKGGEDTKKKASSKNPFETEGGESKNPFDDDDDDDDNTTHLVSLGVHAGNDTLYAEVRDQHVEKFGSFLQNQALVLKESHTNFTSKDTKKNLNEIHQFVKQIPVRQNGTDGCDVPIFNTIWTTSIHSLTHTHSLTVSFSFPFPFQYNIHSINIKIFTQSLRSLTNHIHLAELIKATTEDSSFRDQWNTERAMIEGESCYDILEECISTNYPPYKLLRLLCLQSLCSGGIKSNRYDQFKQSIVQVYGYEFLPTLHNIEKMGFIKRIENRGGGVFANLADGGGALGSGGRSLFQTIKRNLILIHAEVNTTEPDDISYVSSGYAPLTVRLIQSAMQGWIGSSGSGSSNNENNKDDIIKDLFQMMSSMNNSGSGSGNASGGSGGNRLLDIKQTYPPRDLPTTLRRQREQQRSKGGRGGGATKGGSSGNSGGSGGIFESLGSYGKRKSITTTTTTTTSGSSSKNSGTKKKKKPTLIVVYLGGITYMEIASLRFLSKRDSFPYHIIVITTKVLNGTKLIQSMG